MLPFSVFVRLAADKPPVQQDQGINPEVIERVRPVEVQGVDVECAELLIDGAWIQVIGNTKNLIHLISGVAPEPTEEASDGGG